MLSPSLTPYERYLASECDRWFLVGEQTIAKYNISNATGVSFTTFTGMLELKLPFQAWLFSLQYSDNVSPVIYWCLYAKQRVVKHLYPLLDSFKQWLNHTLYESRNPIPLFDGLQWLIPTTSNLTVKNNSKFMIENLTFRKRQLLNWKSNLEAAKEYSGIIADGNFANLAPSLADIWTSGPFFWPPNYDYAQRYHICLAGTLAFNISSQIFSTTVQYYSDSGPKKPNISYTFEEALPKLHKALIRKTPSGETYFFSIIKQFFNDILMIDLDTIRAYTSSPDDGQTSSQLSKDLTKLITCDFVKVQHCSARNKRLLWGGVIIGIFFLFVSFIGKFLYIPMLDSLLVVIYVPVVMVYVFDFSIFCFPMLPTCFMEELMLIVQTALPISFKFPSTLQHWTNCIEGQAGPAGSMIKPGTTDCFLRCSDYPFYYNDWETNLAWIMCEVGYCQYDWIEDTFTPFINSWNLPHSFSNLIDLSRVSKAIRQKQVYQSLGDDYKLAQRACCVLTIFNLLPVIILVFLSLMCCLFFVIAVSNALLQLLAFCINLLEFVHFH